MGRNHLFIGVFVPRGVHAILLAAADAVAHATMASDGADLAQPQLRDQRQDGSVVWDEFTVL